MDYLRLGKLRIRCNWYDLLSLLRGVVNLNGTALWMETWGASTQWYQKVKNATRSLPLSMWHPAHTIKALQDCPYFPNPAWLNVFCLSVPQALARTPPCFPMSLPCFPLAVAPGFGTNGGLSHG